MTHLRSSRRAFVGAGAGLAVGFTLTRQLAFAQGTPETAPVSALSPELPNGGIQADGSWAFTDDLGVTVTADAAPTKVIAHVGMAAALYDFGFEVIGYYNPATDEDGNPLQIAGDLPLDRLTHVGDYDEIDIEQLLSMGADLFIGQNYEVVTGGMWPFSDDVLTQIESVVPVLAFAYGDGATVQRNIETIENLAAALGSNVDDPAIAADRDAFLAATEELRTAIAAKPDLTALFLSGYAPGFWIDSAGPAATSYYRELGMQIVPPPDMNETSWERLLDFPADIIFVDDRAPVWMTPEELAAEIPVWNSHPAVIAGQVGPWRAQFISSYAGFTPILTEVVEHITATDDSIA